ncbi:hypothetical protein QZH41_016711 [Actinostola sp. cb2023]|nr:hypothetical protein QZH41_016711 [Actinostola sp. cb2023]
MMMMTVYDDDAIIVNIIPVCLSLQPKEKGVVLYKQVYEYLNLEECEYFGLYYYDNADHMFWLDQHKPINKQIHDANKVLLRFSVKFYAPDPAMLQEEYTRYMFALQVKRDLLSARLKCSESTAALLASYIVQGEIGDFDSLTCRAGYLSEFQFFPDQNQDTEARIADFHKQHRGLSPSDCDYNLLDVARRLEMYGIILYPARDKDNVELDLAAANMGILVFQSGSKINTLSWAKIRKLSFKRKRFLIKLHPEIFGHYKDVVEFQMSSRNACKSFWKVAISTHAFFRQSQSQSPPKHRPRVFSRGSSYRFSGRTQKQIIESTQEHSRQQPVFNRTQSLKVPNRNNTPRTSQSSSRPYGAYSTPDTRVLEAVPPVQEYQCPETPESEEQNPVPFENGMHESYEELSRDVNGPVIKVHSAENPDEDIPLKDLDHEPDMMKDESSSTSSVVGQDLEWQEEVISGNPPMVNDLNIRYMEPVDYNAENRDGDIILPPGAVEFKPQPRPPTPIEVDGIESPSPPPPPPEEVLSVEAVEVNEGQDEFPAPPVETLPSPPPELLRDSPEPDRVNESPQPPPIVHTNGYHDKASPEPVQMIDTSVVKVQNGEVSRHGKGSTSDEDRDGHDNVFEDQASPQFRSDTEASPPASPTLLLTLKSEQTLSKSSTEAGYNVAKELLNTERTYVKDLEVITIRYVPHLKQHDEVMLNLESATKKHKQFDNVYKEFETQKVCYLPLNAFLLKPSQRLLHYKFLLERILKFCPRNNPDYQDLQDSLQELGKAVRDTGESMKKLENFQKLIELQRDLIGVDNLVQQGRDFVREGCLQKLSRKGPQPRMFFLIEDTGPDLHGLYPFTITYGNKHMVVAVQSEEEKYKWMEVSNHDNLVTITTCDLIPQTFFLFCICVDLQATCSQCMYNRAHHMFKSPNRRTQYFCEECYILVDEDDNKNIQNGEEQHGGRCKILPLPTPVTISRSGSSDDGSDDDVTSTSPVSSLDRRHAHSNTMSTRRVCWHRHTSISMMEHALSVRADNIDKAMVFKLQYKSHVYFFRAENEYSYYSLRYSGNQKLVRSILEITMDGSYRQRNAEFNEIAYIQSNGELGALID